MFDQGREKGWPRRFRHPLNDLPQGFLLLAQIPDVIQHQAKEKEGGEDDIDGAFVGLQSRKTKKIGGKKGQDVVGQKNPESAESQVNHGDLGRNAGAVRVERKLVRSFFRHGHLWWLPGCYPGLGAGAVDGFRPAKVQGLQGVL